MKNTRIPTRPAPSLEEARRKQNEYVSRHTMKKKPPPRPPPPDFSKMKSKSAWNLNQPGDNICLFDWSPPSSPKSATRNFGGSISSSFSSSTSSLASSKKSFEYDTSPFNVTPWNIMNNVTQTSTISTNPVASQISVPTIIRAQPPKRPSNRPNIKPVPQFYIPPTTISSLSRDSPSPPMPLMPPPSPPKDIDETVVPFDIDLYDFPGTPGGNSLLEPMPYIPTSRLTKEVESTVVPFGIALYDFPGTQIGDLRLQMNDIVFLLRRIDREWLYGRIDEREGMFPANFIDIRIPLPEVDKYVKALYEFHPQISGDLALRPGQIVKVLQKISNEWLIGESNGQRGQFPANFVTDL